MVVHTHHTAQFVRHVVPDRTSTAVSLAVRASSGMKAIQSIVKSANALQRAGESKARRYKEFAPMQHGARHAYAFLFSMPDCATELPASVTKGSHGMTWKQRRTKSHRLPVLGILVL